MKKLDEKRIADRYVKALFDVAHDAGSLDIVEKDMDSLRKALAESPEFQAFLTNPLLSYTAKAESMLAILDKMDVDQLSRQFIGMLIHQKRLAILPHVIELFSEWASRARDEIRAEIVTATQLSDNEVSAVSEHLSQAYGKKMNLTVKQDPSLLGGMIVKIGSVQLDSSLAGKMRRLKQSLLAA